MLEMNTPCVTARAASTRGACVLHEHPAGAHAFCIQAHLYTATLSGPHHRYYTCEFTSRGPLRAHRVIFMVSVLHITDTLRPVAIRCSDRDLSPPFGH